MHFLGFERETKSRRAQGFSGDENALLCGQTDFAHASLRICRFFCLFRRLTGERLCLYNNPVFKATLRDRQEYTAKRPGGGRFRLFVFVFSSRLFRRDFLFSEDMRMLQFDKVKRINCGRSAMLFIGDNCADLVRLHRNPNVFTPGYCD